jgi:hypothetical protein
MPLPKISHPTFELKLPSTQEVIKYRPFLVKEEKLLLIAQASSEPVDIVNAIRQVIHNCILTKEVDVNNFTTFDLEYLFLKIRSKSVNNIITLTYKDLEDEQRYEVEINLDDIEIKETEGHTNRIPITVDTGMIMRYPKADLNNMLTEADEEMDVFFTILEYCIEKVYDNQDVYIFSETSEEERDEFIASLDVETFKKIQDFFATMPKLFYEAKYTNSLGKEKVIQLTTLNDFFTLG